MSATERDVARDYAQGGLEEAILGALRAQGKDVEHLVPQDLSPVDEFHIGGRRATQDFAAELTFPAGAHLLDIGCGLGGASRYFAARGGCRVTGIDLSEDFVRTATALAGRVGLAATVTYQKGSAVDLTFPPGTFDGAYMLHVGMNIADKARLFAGIRRVLKPGARFGIYDVMREGAGDLPFPMPWASGAATSFIEPAAVYTALLADAGFALDGERNRRAFALETFAEMRARGRQGASPLGLHLVMGPQAAQKVANMISAVEQGLIAPVEIIARAV